MKLVHTNQAKYFFSILARKIARWVCPVFHIYMHIRLTPFHNYYDFIVPLITRPDTCTLFSAFSQNVTFYSDYRRSFLVSEFRLKIPRSYNCWLHPNLLYICIIFFITQYFELASLISCHLQICHIVILICLYCCRYTIMCEYNVSSYMPFCLSPYASPITKFVCVYVFIP